MDLHEDAFVHLVQSELYANLTNSKKRGRKKGQKNKKTEINELWIEDEEEIIETYGTKSRPNKKKNSSSSLQTTFFSPQPYDFFMSSYYKKYGSVLLLDSPITDLSYDELIHIFQKIFPDVMNCDLKRMLENHTKECVSTIIEKNIDFFKNPKFAIFETERKNIFVASVANLANELVKENQTRTCGICYQKKNFPLTQCIKKCHNFICQPCALSHISQNCNRCVGVGCMSSYDMLSFPIIEQNRIREKLFLNTIVAKRMNEGLFVCDCNGNIDGNDIFFKPNKDCIFTGFVQCPRCDKRLCVACGLNHEEGFCALLINNALDGIVDRKNFKPCPHCATIIEKADGCLHVQCVNCKKFFCFSCGKDLIIFFFFLKNG